MIWYPSLHLKLLWWVTLWWLTTVSLYRAAQAIDILLIFSSLEWHQQRAPEVVLYRSAQLLIFASLDGSSSARLKLCCTAAPRLLVLSSLDDSSCVRLNLCCTPARNQAGALGAIAPSIALAIAPPSRNTLWRFALHPVYSGYRSSPSLLPCLADFIANAFASSWILVWLRAWLPR